MEELDIAIIGGGPAGLRAAEVAASMGRKVTLFEGKPGVGRKFLVAGKGGLNITHGENIEKFETRYSGGELWEEILRDFSPSSLRDWCHRLGQETFQASSGRIYPKTLKGAPLLRAWLARLRNLGIDIRPKHQWKSLQNGNVLHFEHGTQAHANSVIFALGGASWPKTGSDGGWLRDFMEMGISCTPLTAANCGWECPWSESILAAAEGMPIKNITVTAGAKALNGELLLTRYGLEGGTIYALGRELRSVRNPPSQSILSPHSPPSNSSAKLSGVKGNLLESASKRWKLSPGATAILSRKTYPSAEALVAEAKSCEIAFERSRPVEEAISSAGGISWSEVNKKLMLTKLPGVFICGEMLDWEAPTGGYLLQGAFATGTRAGASAAEHAASLPFISQARQGNH